MFKRNVELHPALKMTAWRKISVGSWRPIGDSQVYCELDLDAEPALRWLESINQSHPDKNNNHSFGGKGSRSSFA